MCGIVGYVGHQKPKSILVGGLEKLEYRGYDSSGVAIFNKGRFEICRSEGKLSALKKILEEKKFQGFTGIGHTRWATHGPPTQVNAHPHRAENVTLVHNGIIENYEELKTRLVKEGVAFTSDTDSEIVAHLISLELKETGQLIDAVRKTIPQLEGAFAILVVSEDEPDSIIAFKSGPPLIIGQGEGEVFLASDVQALINHTKSVIYLEDLQIAEIKKDKILISDFKGQNVTPKTVILDIESENSDKKGFDHFMLKEIFEQPRAVASAVAPFIDLAQLKIDDGSWGLCAEATDAKNLEALKKVNRIYLVACGTSFYAAQYGKYLFEKMARIPVEVDIASEFRYRNPVLEKDSLFMVISQSGETADTLAALRLAKGKGLLTASLCNTKMSTIDRECDIHLYMNSGVEIGVASTKAFVSSLAVLNCLALYFGSLRNKITSDELKEALEALLAVPSQMEGLFAYDKFFREASETLKKFNGFLYLGRGPSYPIAMEGALKLKELAYLHAEGYAAGEMKHGPLALIDENMVTIVVAPKDEYYVKTISNLEEAKARGAVIIALGSGQDKALSQLSHNYLSLPPCHWAVSGLLSTIPLQLLSYHLAAELGYNVDQPRNLAKSVTVE